MSSTAATTLINIALMRSSALAETKWLKKNIMTSYINVSVSTL